MTYKLNIPITKPFLGEEELQAVQKPLKSGWVVQGPYVREFEKKFSNYTGARFSVATSSCTAALHIALVALGLKPGDEVIVPAFTWVSTANVVEYVGAKPIFCDIDLRTFNMNFGQIEELITPHTVGIIPVHLFGLCSDMEPIMEIALRHKLWVVEDAACAFGALYKGQHAGTFGEMGCFSFHPRKSITTGEGGMITTNREDFAEVAKSLRDHGASRSDWVRQEGKNSFILANYNHLGYNYRMTDIQGAVGCVQIDRAKWILNQRRRRASLYDEMLSQVEWLVTPTAQDGYIHAYQAYVCLFRPEEPTFGNVEELNESRNYFMRELEKIGIFTRPGTHAVTSQGYYKKKYGIHNEDYPQAFLADRLTLTLPLYPHMTDKEQNSVVSNLKKLFKEELCAV